MSEMTYNGTDITPVPMITTMRRQYNITESGLLIGYSYVIEISGVLITTVGFSDLMTQKASFAALWDCPGGDLVVTCNSVELLRACIATIDLQFTQTSNNWVKTIDYTISLTSTNISNMSACPVSQNLKSATNDWSIQEEPECYQFNLTGEDPLPRTYVISRTISATAADTCGTGQDGWLIAKEFVDANLSFDTGLFSEIVDPSCLPDFDLYNESRVNNIGKLAGSYSVNQNWVLVETTTGETPNTAKEVFTVNIQEDSEASSTVTVEGSIEGYESVSYTNGCKDEASTKLANAQAYWDVIRPKLPQRAAILSSLDLRSYPLTKSVMYSPKVGQIKYSYAYTDLLNCLDEPTGCEIKSESIDISYTNPADVYAEIQILGRPCPILQCLGIRTKGQKSLAVKVNLSCGKFCPSDPEFSVSPIRPNVQDLVDGCYGALTGDYETVTTDGDSETWNPKTGSYTRNVTWSYAECCTNTDTGFLFGSESYIESTGEDYTPLFYSVTHITGCDTGQDPQDEIVLPAAGNNIGKRLDLYNESECDFEITLQYQDSFYNSPDTVLEADTNMSAIVVARNTWQLTALA